jgi:hypothetical protein
LTAATLPPHSSLIRFSTTTIQRMVCRFCSRSSPHRSCADTTGSADVDADADADAIAVLPPDTNRREIRKRQTFVFSATMTLATKKAKPSRYKGKHAVAEPSTLDKVPYSHDLHVFALYSRRSLRSASCDLSTLWPISQTHRFVCESESWRPPILTHPHPSSPILTL